MRKALIILIISFCIANLAEAQTPQYFNPFRWGIKTTTGIRTLEKEEFRNAVRKKAAELLNIYFNTTTFQVSGDKIINTAGLNVDNKVRESYGSWRNLIREAADSLLKDEAELKHIGYDEYLNWTVLDVKFDTQGRLEKIIIAPARYLAGLPTISPCSQGIGQCMLFIFDKALRILYTLALALGVILLMWAGILYITKPTEAEKIHSRIQWGVIGIVVSIISFTIVIALENWLITGLGTPTSSPSPEQVEKEREELIGLEQGRQDEFPSQPGPSPSTPTQKQGTLIINSDTAMIREDGTFVVLVEARNTPCYLKWKVLNITQGFEIYTVPNPYVSPYKISPEDLQFLDIKFQDTRSKPGDKIRIIFNTTRQVEDENIPPCLLSLYQLTLNYPSKKEISEKEFPTLTLDLKEIRGQQYLKVELPDNIKDALEQALGIGVVQRNLYNPPFSLKIGYIVEPSNQNGYCTLYANVRGSSVSSLSADKTKAVSLYVFNRDFTINLSYKAGKKDYVVVRYIPLPSNTIGFVRIEIYDYEGSCKIDNLPIKKIFDIETGKIYLEGGLGDIVKQILFGIKE